MTSYPCVTVCAFSFLQIYLFQIFSLLSSLSTHSGTTHPFQPLKPNQNFCFKFWTPWLNLDSFGVSCLGAGCCSAPSLRCKTIWNSTIAVWCFSWESEEQKDATLWRSKWFSSSEHLPFGCEKALNATNGVSILGEAGWELMQILLSQLLVYLFLKTLAALHKQNCPHKDRKLSNRGIALVLRANVTVNLNNNFKT